MQFSMIYISYYLETNLRLMWMERIYFTKALVAWDLQHISTIGHRKLPDPITSDKLYSHKTQTTNG